MAKLRKRLYELLKEKAARVAGRKAAVPKGDEATAACDWLSFRSLTDGEIVKKLARLSGGKMLELYQKLEREVGLRIDSENYKPHKIVKNFLLLWKRKLLQERRKAAQGEKLEPLTKEEGERIFNDGRRGITGRRTSGILGRDDDW